MSTFQVAEVTLTLDANGYGYFTFDSHIDKAMISVNTPQTGGDLALIGANVQVTGDKTVGFKVWHSGSSPSYSAKPAASQQVTVTILGIAG